MNKIIGISTSYNSESKSKKIIEEIKNQLKDQIKEEISLFDLKEQHEFDIHCEGCEQCISDSICVREGNQLLIKRVLESDTIIFAFPIYYGSLSGKSKSVLDAFYCLKGEELKNKKAIFILSSQNENQEGIGVLQILPWAYKHSIDLAMIEVIYDDMEESKRQGIIEKIKKTIVEKNKDQLDIEFAMLNYFDKEVEIPIKINKRN